MSMGMSMRANAYATNLSSLPFSTSLPKCPSPTFTSSCFPPFHPYTLASTLSLSSSDLILFFFLPTCYPDTRSLHTFVSFSPPPSSRFRQHTTSPSPFPLFPYLCHTLPAPHSFPSSLLFPPYPSSPPSRRHTRPAPSRVNILSPHRDRP